VTATATRRRLRLGLAANWRQFTLLVVVNAFVGAMVGTERTVLPLLARSEFGIASASAVLSFLVAFGLVKAGTNLAAGHFSDRYGRKPLVAMTFVCFAAFPLAVILARDFAGMTAAFIIGGLRELGEPARKAMIVDLADPARRGRTVGLYYLIRSLSVTPAAAIGGLLWRVRPPIPFIVAFAVGIVGTAVFVATVKVNRGEQPKG